MGAKDNSDHSDSEDAVTEGRPLRQTPDVATTGSLPLETGGGGADSARWLSSLDTCVHAIVSLRMLHVRAFDDGVADYSQATGFIVDKEQGLILTNRHVVTPGPVVADAIFHNKEEVDLVPVYRDPVHDFGFFRFDPKKVRFMELEEIPLRPDEAKVGVEIRVVGNDSGEKLSILPGILAKLDREAPQYGSDTYNDFNTFYYAAASSTSGGSSGSPVLNINGNAIALNAGGHKMSASSYYLPLDRVVRALDYVRKGENVPRGTIQTVFRHTAFDEVRRLGLPTESESAVRAAFPKETGMLIVNQVLPNGPADGKLQTGDIILQYAGKLRTTFVEIEEFEDDNVGGEVQIQVQRGEETFEVSVSIQDLHDITPDSFLEVSGGIVHSFSYQLARSSSMACGGVFIAEAGHMFVRAGMTHGCIITSVNGVETPDLETFEKIVAQLPDQTRTVFRFYYIRDRHRARTAFVSIDRRWFSMQLYTRNDEDGVWHPRPSPVPKDKKEREEVDSVPTPLHFPGGSQIGEKVLQSLVTVRFDVPYAIDGLSSNSYYGTGVVVDASQGMVLVDQNTVPMALGDVIVTFAASVESSAKVVLVHPIHNFAIVQYDPIDLGPMATTIPSIQFAASDVQVGEQTQFIGLSSNWSVVAQTVQVTKQDRMVMRDFSPPRFKQLNAEVLYLDRMLRSHGGVLINDQGQVTTLWQSFSYSGSNSKKEVYRGLPASVVVPVVNKIREGELPQNINLLPMEHLVYSLSKARSGGLGISSDWIQRLEQKYKDKRQVLGVKRTFADTECASRLEGGDVILSIDGQVIVRDADVDMAVGDQEQVEMLIVRNQKEMVVSVPTAQLSAIGTDRVVFWSGLMVQNPHLAVRVKGFVPPEGGGVYISRWLFGSPAHKYGLHATIWVVEVNGKSTKTLDDFLNVVKKLGNGESVRLKTIGMNTKQRVYTLRTDYHYWPTVEICRKGLEWEQVAHTTLE